MLPADNPDVAVGDVPEVFLLPFPVVGESDGHEDDGDEDHGEREVDAVDQASRGGTGRLERVPRARDGRGVVGPVRRGHVGGVAAAVVTVLKEARRIYVGQEVALIEPHSQRG